MAGDNIFLYQNEIPENSILSHHHSIINDVPLHWHNFIEIELVLSGSANHIHNGIVSPIKRGHVSIFRINDYHAIENSNNLEIISLSIKDSAFSEKSLNELNSVQDNLSFNLNEEAFNTIRFFCEACIKENSLHNRNELYIKNLLECVLILLLRQDISSPRPIKKHQNSQLNKAIEYMHSHFRENPNLSTVASIAHYSPTHFSHVFHKKIGKSYNDYLNELKVSYAKQLLTTTNLKVIDVGYQSGFNSYNNFYSTFKQYTTLSPAEYKKKKSTNVHSLGYSWRFSILDTDINTSPAYVYIITPILKHDTEYYFSYYYSYDYAIVLDKIENAHSDEKIEATNIKTINLKDRRRTHKVEFYFKTTEKSRCRITLKMGKGLNNTNCNYDYTKLSNLVLYETTKDAPKMNLALGLTHANGSVSWTDNSDAYDEHIDR